ncbi:MAG: hypothetical protein KF817_12585 [Phycisphaeraceae bacterium]|nr:hypothetical protein [Phycisphaeraceae bacterium]
MAQIEIIEERSEQGRWVYTAQVLADDGTLRRHEVTLSWADYNLWSTSGTDEPASVVTAALVVLLAHADPARLRPRLDCATIRRLVAGADDLIPAAIRPEHH